MNDHAPRAPERRWIRRSILGLALLGCAGAACWRFPLFRVVPLELAHQEQRASAFDAAEHASRFWESKLLPAADRAIELNDLLAALREDAAAARALHGRALGIGGATLFLVRGSGRVAAVGDEAVEVTLDGGAHATVRLATGLLFGNAVRDATGLLDVSAFPNSQDFNALSTELNLIVETQVAPALRDRAAVGKAIRFAGCAELEEGAEPQVLTVIPLRAEWP